MGLVRNLVFLFTIASCLLPSISLADTPPDLPEKIDALMKQVMSMDAFSGNVLVARDGKVVYQKSFGYADWERKTPLTDSTVFNIGSNGKDFTQTLICQLVQEGKLHFEDRLNQFLKVFPEEMAHKITIRHLLTMSSGMGDYMQSPRFEHGKYRSIPELVSFIKDEPLFFEPGTDRLYSNSGYVVLGGIIEKVTGKSYPENVRERILKPLGMMRSVFVFPDTKGVRDKAMGTEISLSGEKRNEQRVQSTLIPTSAGGMYSSAPDMLKFYEAWLFSDILLKDEMKIQLFSRYDPKPGVKWSEMVNDKNFISALAGGLNGWNSVVFQIPSQRYTIIVLSNFDENGQPAEQVGSCISRIIRNMDCDPMVKPFGRSSYQYIKTNGIVDYVTHFMQFVEKNGYQVEGPMLLNAFGYDLIGEKELNMAVEVFKLNIKLFPEEANGYDSLGEAYWLLKQKSPALKNYRTALEMSENENVKERIRKTIKQIEDSR